jgi:hypothetical protein
MPLRHSGPMAMLILLWTIGGASVARSQETAPADATAPSAPDVPAPEATASQPPDPQPMAAEPVVDEARLGGAGESCRARADCKSGLKCVEAACQDELEGTTCQSSAECGALRCIANVCTSGLVPTGGGNSAQNANGPDGPGGSGWLDFEFGEGTHGFAGISMQGGPAEIVGFGGNSGSIGIEPSWAFDFYGGVLFGRFELAAHFSPVAYKAYDLVPDTQMALRVTAGGYIEMSDMLSWVMRGGVGFAAVNTNLPNDDILPMVQADLIGLAIHVGHLNIEFSAPSFRLFVATDAEVMVMNWHFGPKLAYVF